MLIVYIFEKKKKNDEALQPLVGFDVAFYFPPVGRWALSHQALPASQHMAHTHSHPSNPSSSWGGRGHGRGALHQHPDPGDVLKFVPVL